MAVTLSLPMQALLFLLVGLAGFVDSAAGGGGLISLPAYLFVGLPAHTAYGCNKFSSSFGTTFAVANYFKSGALDLKVALCAAAASFAGSTLASRATLYLSEQAFRKLIIIVIPFACAVIFAKRTVPDVNTSDTLPRGKKLLFALLIGFFIGGYDGLVGPGTGTFAILAFCALMRYDLRTASGNAKLLNLASNYASLITCLMAGTVIFRYGILTAISNAIGCLLGSRLALKNGAKFIRPMLLVVMSMLLVQLAWDLFFIKV